MNKIIKKNKNRNIPTESVNLLEASEIALPVIKFDVMNPNEINIPIKLKIIVIFGPSSTSFSKSPSFNPLNYSSKSSTLFLNSFVSFLA